MIVRNKMERIHERDRGEIGSKGNNEALDSRKDSTSSLLSYFCFVFVLLCFWSRELGTLWNVNWDGLEG